MNEHNKEYTFIIIHYYSYFKMSIIFKLDDNNTFLLIAVFVLDLRYLHNLYTEIYIG